MNALDAEDFSAAVCDGKGCGDARVRARWVSALPGGGVLCWCSHHAGFHRAALEHDGALTYQLTAV